MDNQSVPPGSTQVDINKEGSDDTDKETEGSDDGVREDSTGVFAENPLENGELLGAVVIPEGSPEANESSHEEALGISLRVALTLNPEEALDCTLP